jgi:hypothetical protein
MATTSAPGVLNVATTTVVGDVTAFPWVSTVIGLVVGYVAGAVIDHSGIGAVVGAGAGYLYGGGAVPFLVSPNTSTGAST